MPDWHVERLRFLIQPEESTEYRSPTPLSVCNALGTFRTEGMTLIVEPADHFASEAEARAVIEPFLRAWEIETDLTQAIGAIRFKFERAEVINRDPQPGGAILLGAATVAATGTVSARATAVRAAFPPPPRDFRTSPEVQAAYQRWRNVKAGREPILGVAYYLLTVLERGRSRKDAATAFNIHSDVLKTLGRLSSTLGNLQTARKLGDGPQRDPTPAERHWLEEALKLIIRRMGEQGSGSSTTELTMNHLPPI